MILLTTSCLIGMYVLEMLSRYYNNVCLFISNMEELLHSLYHSARQRLGDEVVIIFIQEETNLL